METDRSGAGYSGDGRHSATKVAEQRRKGCELVAVDFSGCALAGGGMNEEWVARSSLVARHRSLLPQLTWRSAVNPAKLRHFQEENCLRYELIARAWQRYKLHKLLTKAVAEGKTLALPNLHSDDGGKGSKGRGQRRGGAVKAGGEQARSLKKGRSALFDARRMERLLASAEAEIGLPPDGRVCRAPHPPLACALAFQRVGPRAATTSSLSRARTLADGLPRLPFALCEEIVRAQAAGMVRRGAIASVASG